ncbi:pentapeptide repeat-containing protein [Haloarcula sp. JP-L23]|uniref:pentapeptide repeat-containing protein n=1 Tax=Haloarcula sp. JP-L23 TaxID=2716717 RepID=UPI00140EF132|nr:pentapeptide repeat-containing protein [Haloarcula sp. JP-L23]
MVWSGAGDGQCRFQCEPAAQHESIADSETWRCPHDAMADADHCPFHRPPAETPADVDVSAAFLDAVESGADGDRTARRRSKQFLGADIATLDLSMAVVDATDNYPIDLRGASIDRLDGTDSEVGQRLDLRGATVGELRLDGVYHELDARGATVESGAFAGVRVDGVDCRDATFEAVDFDRASVGEAAFDDATVGDGSFHHTDFGMADFDDATFGGGYFNETSYDEAVFERIEAERFYLPDATLAGGTFADAAVSMKLVLKNSTFVGTDFTGLDAERVDLTGSTLVRPTVDDATVADLQLDEATLASPRLTDCVVDRVTAADVRCLGVVAVEDCTVDTVDLSPMAAGPDGVALVSLSGSAVGGGTLGQPADGTVVYDLEQATLGTVKFTGGGSDGPLDRLAFHRTRFDGFDVRDDDDVDLEAADYRLHELADALAAPLRTTVAYPNALETVVDAAGDETVAALLERAATRAADQSLPAEARERYDRLATAVEGTIPAADGEVTYLRAKNGANDIADNTAASAFFVSQLAYRRRTHAGRVVDRSTPLWGRVRSLGRWGLNGFLFLTTGYGERPSYTLGASVALVVGYAALYLALAPRLFADVGQYLQLSLGSFIAFFLGGVGAVDDGMVNVVAQSEAFLGAFFIALYVFALTRSVSR